MIGIFHNYVSLPEGNYVEELVISTPNKQVSRDHAKPSICCSFGWLNHTGLPERRCPKMKRSGQIATWICSRTPSKWNIPDQPMENPSMPIKPPFYDHVIGLNPHSWWFTHHVWTIIPEVDTGNRSHFPILGIGLLFPQFSGVIHDPLRGVSKFPKSRVTLR